MLKTLCNIASLALLVLFFSGNARAQNGPGWVEIDGQFRLGGISSSPVSGFSTSKSPGIGLRIGKEVFAKGLNVYGGIDFGSQGLSLTGRKLGNVDSTTFSGGLRYHFGDSDVVRPYIGLGLHYTSYDGSSLGNGTLRIKDNGGIGLSSTVGVRFQLNKTALKNEAIHFVNIGVTKDVERSQTLETTTGAKVSDLKFNSTRFMIGVGREF